MSALDVVLVIATLGYGLSGYVRGLVSGVAATVGLLLGGAVGIVAVPRFLDDLDPSVGLSLTALFCVLLLASLGQALGSYLGGRLRARITWRPARSLDAIGGAVLSMAAVLSIAWALGYAISGSRLPVIADAVRSSAVLARIDTVMPKNADAVLSAFNRIVDPTLFPRYLEPFAPERIVGVDPPNAAVLRRPDVATAGESVVKVLSESVQCAGTIEGSGFVYAPGRVMTNAHVVAGVSDPVVVVADRSLDATVVLYDSELDVAVLAVDGLSTPALDFDTSARAADPAVVLGFPENGPFDAQPARIRAEQRLSSPDIYEENTVVRQVFSIRSLVRSGNSGGPLVSPRGDVYGVVFAASLRDVSTGYALTAEQVAADARAGRAAVREVSTGDCT
ncbi:MAG: MarP family serine protease [Nocardioidaceae bacterium]|nr:MarP family serine protease [Nocardioidaceae bacterium]